MTLPLPGRDPLDAGPGPAPQARIRVSERLQAAMDAAAARLGVTRSEAWRMAAEEWLRVEAATIREEARGE